MEQENQRLNRKLKENIEDENSTSRARVLNWLFIIVTRLFSACIELL